MKSLAIVFVLFSSVTIARPNDGRLYGRSKGKLTMLGYSLGEDRLGGAKAGYIDTGILLQITDSVRDMYKVSLSRLHNAWISKADFRPDTSFQIKPYYLT
ncbi:MAG TPA: hypothetical protein VF540_07460, partial [Segetibacter sp.]